MPSFVDRKLKFDAEKSANGVTAMHASSSVGTLANRSLSEVPGPSLNTVEFRKKITFTYFPVFFSILRKRN